MRAWILSAGLLPLVAAVGCWGGHRPEAGRAEAIAAIEGVGGTVVYEEGSPDGAILAVDLRDAVDRRNSQVTDAVLEHLKGLGNLRSLVLSQTQITDAGMEHLEGLTGLEELLLTGTQITDDGLEHLKGLTSLKVLEVSGTKVSDDGVSELKQALADVKIYR